MESLEVKTAEFDIQPEMRCQGMCKGSCSCPTGHCRCKLYETYSSIQNKDNQELYSSDSYHFRKAA